ncbi:GTP-binding protein Rho1 [Balamuthia mandrillaris]
MDNSNSKAQTLAITQLPQEILLEVFSFLNAAEDLCRVAQACRLFAALSREDCLWEPLGCPSWEQQDPCTSEQQQRRQGKRPATNVVWKQRYMAWMKQTVEEWHALRPSFPAPTHKQSTQQADEPLRVAHFCLIGPSFAGKTTFLQRYDRDVWPPDEHARLPVEFSRKDVLVNNQKLKLFVWEPAGNERLPRYTRHYIRRKHAVAICYDSTDAQSFQALHSLHSIVEQLAAEHKDCRQAARILVACKCDMKDECQVTEEMAEVMAAKWNAFAFIRTSSKTGENVPETIELLTAAVMDPFLRLPPHKRPRYVPRLATLQANVGSWDVLRPRLSPSPSQQASHNRCVAS